MTPADFLLARIAEDEEDVRRLFSEPGFDGRVLAECEAKRRIVAMASDVFAAIEAGGCGGDVNVLAGRGGALAEAVQILTMPYSDHPDYDERWMT